MQFGTLYPALLTVLSLCSLSPGQQNQLTPSVPPGTHAIARSQKPKLTPDQKHGLRLLKASEGEAAGLEPAMRAFVLWQVSHGYSKVLPEKSATVLREAFKVSESIDQDTPPEGCDWEECHMKRYLQRQLAVEFMNRSESSGQFDELEQLLTRMEPKVRQQIVVALIMHYAQKEQFSRARRLLNQIADDEQYPYYAAEELMLRDSNPDDRLAVFSEAVARFRQEHNPSPGGDDIATLVIRFSRDLPTTAVLDAIDQIFARAKEQDDDEKDPFAVHAEVGSVFFQSRYELRLFQLVPVLEDLDKPRAESLVRDNTQLGKAFDKFPQGLKSMDPQSFTDTPPAKDEYTPGAEVSVIPGNDATSRAEEQAKDEAASQIEFKMERVSIEAEKDPKQAYHDAQELPLQHPQAPSFSPRAAALREVALSGIKKDPATAEAAMNDMRKMVATMDLAVQGRLLTAVPNFYVEVGDLEEARASIRELMKLADKLYARDTDSSDPNLLFNGFWPSTALWRRCIQFAAKVAPEFAEEMLAQIPDADIAGFQRVIYGASLAGAPPFSAAVVEWHKGGKHSGVMF